MVGFGYTQFPWCVSSLPKTRSSEKSLEFQTRREDMLSVASMVAAGQGCGEWISGLAGWLPRACLLSEDQTLSKSRELEPGPIRLKVWETNPTCSRQYEYVPFSFQSMDTSLLLISECRVGPSSSPSYTLQVHPSLETLWGTDLASLQGSGPSLAFLLLNIFEKFLGKVIGLKDNMSVA